MIRAALLLITFFFFLKLIIFIACSHKDSQNFLIQSLPLCTSCLFSRLLNDDIVDIENLDRRCSLISVVNKFMRNIFTSTNFFC